MEEDPGDFKHWKKPKGVFKAINAFEKTSPASRKKRLPPPRLRKVRHVVKAASILAENTKDKNYKNRFDLKSTNLDNSENFGKVSTGTTRKRTQRLRKVGHLAAPTPVLS